MCSCMKRMRTRRSLLLRVCALLTLLCVCVCVSLTAWSSTHTLHKHTAERRNQEESDLKSTSTCCSPHKHHRPVLRWRIDLEPWANGTPALQEEAQRFLSYISTPQVSCDAHREDYGPWALCLDQMFSLAQRIQSKHCRVYSLRLGSSSSSADVVERALASSGCDVHCFDPSISSAHLQQQQHLWLHRLSVDWRDPNPAVPPHRAHSNSRKLKHILNHFGHRQVDVLKVDVAGAEWALLENLILDQVLEAVGVLLLELHLHWPGFEVGGDEPAVLRYWFSLMRELERAHFRLYHSYSDPNKPHIILHRNLQNASGSFSLGWVNTRFQPQD